YAECQRQFPELPVQCGSLFVDSSSFDCVCLSSGLSRSRDEIRPFVEAGIPVFGEIELFAQLNPSKFSKVIAITGSNGKTTTVSLVAHLLQFLGYSAVTIGNIGYPVLDFYSSMISWPDFLVLELSSFQLENTFSLRKDVSTFLNIVSDHIDYHGDFVSYRNAKYRVHDCSSMLVINDDDEFLHELISCDAPSIHYSLHEDDSDFTIKDNSIFYHQSIIGSLDSFSLFGVANRYNMLAALSVCYAMVGDEIFNSTPSWSKFEPLPHRNTYVATYGGVSFYNDSKATNVGATTVSLQNFYGRVILLLGGIAKGQDFSSLRGVVAHRVKMVFVFGQDAFAIIKSIYGAVPIVRVDNLKEAVDASFSCALPGDTVLLSPSCSSFDQFRDFQARGNLFCQYVCNLVASPKRGSDGVSA
ncbi:UDP-N-acetylmuramoyl-L-alanine--D-glutamate ligase, partial [Candidatus Ichthyocystis sparus]